MAKMDKISQAIMDKVKAEAGDIIKEAEDRAREDIAQAKKRQQAKVAEEKSRVLQGARGEATRIVAQAAVKARQEMSQAKADVIEEIVSGVKKSLADKAGDKSLLKVLLEEAAATLDTAKGRAYVSPRDVGAAKKLLGGDKGLAARIVEVRECDCAGGVIVEDIDGKVRIDNTYDTRLEMLLPQMLPEIGRELF